MRHNYGFSAAMAFIVGSIINLNVMHNNDLALFIDVLYM